jgi:hypothetical protein
MAILSNCIAALAANASATLDKSSSAKPLYVGRFFNTVINRPLRFGHFKIRKFSTR